MAQNITTLLDKTEITAADIRSLESTVDNFLYLVHGTGSTRDRKLNLKQLRVWLSLLTELTLVKAFTGGQSTVEMDGESINLSATGTAVTDNSAMEISRLGLEISRSSAGGTSDKLSFDADDFELSHTENDQGTEVTTKSYIKYDRIGSSKAIIKRILGNIGISAIAYKLIVDSNLEIGDPDDSTRGAGLKVHGKTTLEDDLTVDKILPSDGATSDSIEIGKQATGNSYGGIKVNGHVRTDASIIYGALSCKGSIKQDIQDYDFSDPPTVNVEGGSVIKFYNYSGDKTVNLTTLLSGAYVGQRFTVLTDTFTSATLTIDHGDNGDGNGTNKKDWKMTGSVGCDFVCIEGGNSPRFIPIGCGERVAHS